MHVQRGAVDVAIKVELHRDVGLARLRARRHQRNAGNGRKGALKRRGDRGRHRLGVGARQLRGNVDGREVHAGQRRDRQLHVSENAEDDKRHHQQCRHHRSADAEFRKRHYELPFFGAASRVSTRAPLVRASAPSVTTVSPPLRPESTISRPSCDRPSSTLRIFATPSSTI